MRGRGRSIISAGGPLEGFNRTIGDSSLLLQFQNTVLVFLLAECNSRCTLLLDRDWSHLIDKSAQLGELGLELQILRSESLVLWVPVARIEWRHVLQLKFNSIIQSFLPWPRISACVTPIHLLPISFLLSSCTARTASLPVTISTIA